MFGVGFTVADRIAHAGEREPDPALRRPAARCTSWRRPERSGSSCLPLPAVLEEAARSCSAARPTRDTVDALVAGGRLVREQDWIYRAATAELEAELAARVDRLITDGPSDRLAGPDRPTPDRGARSPAS